MKKTTVQKILFSEKVAQLYNKVGIFVILILLVMVCSIISPVFLSKTNIINLLTQTAVVTIIACGITMVVISGNTDLSAGSMVALTGCLTVGLYKTFTQTYSMSPFSGAALSILSSIAVSLVIYTAAAIIITRYNTPAFIVTLAVSQIARGIVYLYTKGKVINTIGRIVVIGQGKMFNILPYPAAVSIIIAIISWFILSQLRIGKYLYAVGGNAESARAAGISKTKTVIFSFVVHAIFTAIAGGLFMARMNSGQPSAAVGLEFQAITAAIIGGVSLAGGIGTISGTIIGSLIIGIIGNILTLEAVQSYYQMIITGLIIVFAVVIDIKTKGGKRK
jgi:inositol transport system permease protein